jgi:hypothetical protein
MFEEMCKEAAVSAEAILKESSLTEHKTLMN